MMIYKTNKTYWQIAKRLSTAQLQIDTYEDAYFTDQDLFNPDSNRRGHNFFLGYYSHKGLKLIIQKYGILEVLEKKGFKDVNYIIDTDDPYVHKLMFYHKKNMIIEAVLKRETLSLDIPDCTKLHGKRISILSIEWLSMQNPYGEFTIKRPQLPAQQHPGLGLASQAVEMFMIAAWRLKLGGLINTPQQYHNAYLYSRIFFYLNPDHQAMLMAMIRDTKRYPLFKVAWALEWNAIHDLKNDKPAEWFAAKQIVPLDEELKKVFNSWNYRRKIKKLSENYKFRLDEDKYAKIKKIKKDKEDK